MALFIFLRSITCVFVYLSPVKQAQLEIFNNSYTVLHLGIASVTDTDSPKVIRAGCDRVL